MLKDTYYTERPEVDQLIFEKLVPLDHYLRRVKQVIDFERFRAARQDSLRAPHTLLLHRVSLTGANRSEFYHRRMRQGGDLVEALAVQRLWQLGIAQISKRHAGLRIRPGV